MSKLYIWFWKILLYSKYNFFIKIILYYLSFSINRMYKSLILLNIFQLNYMIMFDKHFKIMSIKKSHNYLKWLCTKKKRFIVFYLNDFYDLLNLALNLPNYIKDNLILQIFEQYLFVSLWLLNLSFILDNQIIIILIF